MESSTPLSQTDQLLMMSLSKFYHDPDNMRAVLPYMNNASAVSLRMIDWFVTNYSKKYNIFLSRTQPVSNTVIEYFNVYVNYRVQLKAYSKQQFDPFRRRDRILLEYDEGTKHVQTTVGQLNFFRWLLQNGILDYIVANSAAIESDMVHSDRSTYQRSSRRNRASVALTLDVGNPSSSLALSPSLSPSPIPSLFSSCKGSRRTELSKGVVPTMNRHEGVCTVMFT